MRNIIMSILRPEREKGLVVSDRGSEAILQEHSEILNGPDPIRLVPLMTMGQRDEFNSVLMRPENSGFRKTFLRATRHAFENRKPGSFGPSWNARLVSDPEALMDAAHNSDYEVSSADDVGPGDEFYILRPEVVPPKHRVGLASYARGNLGHEDLDKQTAQGAKVRVLEVNGEEAVCLYLDPVNSSGNLLPHGSVYRCPVEKLAMNPRILQGRNAIPAPYEHDGSPLTL